MAVFDGMSAFPITPTDEDGRVDTDALARLVERLKTASVTSVGLLGSTGTYVFLSRKERRRAVAAAAEVLGGEVPLLVGVGALRTDAASALARDAEAAGADAVLLAPVSYTPLTDEEVYQHCVAVAGATSLPLAIYNNPGTTRFSFSADLLARLAEVSNVTAVKMPLPADGDLAADLARLRAALPASFQIGYSGDWGCSEAMLAGADTWYSVIGGTLPGPSMALAKAALGSDRSAAERIDAGFAPLWALFQEFGSLRVVYAMVNMLGLTDAVPPRPILPLSSADRDRVAAAMDAIKG